MAAAKKSSKKKPAAKAKTPAARKSTGKPAAKSKSKSAAKAGSKSAVKVSSKSAATKGATKKTPGAAKPAAQKSAKPAAQKSNATKASESTAANDFVATSAETDVDTSGESDGETNSSQDRYRPVADALVTDLEAAAGDEDKEVAALQKAIDGYLRIAGGGQPAELGLAEYFAEDGGVANRPALERVKGATDDDIFRWREKLADLAGY